MIDTHVHLFDKQFTDDFDNVLDNALKANVSKMILVGYSPQTNQKVLQLTKKYNCLYPSIGLHPSDVNQFTDKDLEDLENVISSNKIYAIGECGLDYYWHKDNLDKQKYFFEKQINLAIKYRLPLIIHCRDAYLDTFNILQKYESKVEFLMHSYSGSKEMCEKFLKIGGYIALSGPLTFSNAKEPKEVLKVIPDDRLIVETDCPYLTPHPFRGRRNEPAYLQYIIKEIARLKNSSEDIIDKITTNNAICLFKLEEKQ